MQNKNKFDEKKKELEKIIEELKESEFDISNDEMEELESLMNECLKTESKPLWKKLFSGFLFVLTHFVVLYFLSMVAFGIFFETLALSNKWLIFLVSLVISLVLTIFEDIPRNPFRRHFISINLMILLVIVIGFYIVNRDIYQVFQSSITTIFYLFTVITLFIMIDYSIIRKYLFKSRR